MRRAGARRAVRALCAALACAALAAGGAARADEPSPASDRLGAAWDALANGGWWGKIHLDVRARVELADFRGDAPDDAQAYTIRTRLGYQSPKWRGFSFFAEGENVTAFGDQLYWDGNHAPNGQTLVADPETTELNQGYLKYERAEYGLALAGGRQRIVLDDMRFIGNVGWRQNEQTFDAFSAKTSFGVQGLSLFYAYVWHVNRIWGDKSYAPPANRDYGSDSHLVNVSYAFGPALTATLFAYLLDFGESSPLFSSRSYGVRVTGGRKLGERFSLAYAASYAFQTEAGENPVDYGASYVAADGSLRYAPLGALGVGYELLGSDGGRARFVTPLATGHAFNGWADAFQNGFSPDGLQDFYLYLAPGLPWGLTAKLVYHRFWSDEGGVHLGDEYDAQLTVPLHRSLTLLTKVAYLESTRAGPPSRWRFWIEVTFKF